MNLGGLQIASLVSQEAEAEAGGALGAEAGLHLNAVPEEVLGQLTHSLAALHGGQDGGGDRESATQASGGRHCEPLDDNHEQHEREGRHEDADGPDAP